MSDISSIESLPQELAIAKNQSKIWLEQVLSYIFSGLGDGVVTKSENELTNTLTKLLPIFSKVEYKLNFFKELSNIKKMLLEDADAIFQGDPAAISHTEVILTYPGFLAISVHRISNHFYNQQQFLFARLLAEYAHSLTGIDIHPGATIGPRFCIDHGTGIVIGETSIIGKDVKIYQGVTLGGLSVYKQQASKKRHPTIEDNVVIYANATILGGETVIGTGSTIGGNVWITRSIPAGSTALHKAEVEVK